MIVDDLRLVYHDFNGIYNRHFYNAKLGIVKSGEFRSLKKRLITVRHLLEKCPELAPGKRTELIQAVLSEDNLQRAQQIFPKPDKNNHPSLWSKVTGFFSGSKDTDEKSLRMDVKKITSSVSDSQFLLQLKGVHDKDLETAIQVAVDLACSQLSHAIDAAVRKMTHVVLRMQKYECKRSMQREVEPEERKELGCELADFIHAINEVSARRRTS